MSRSCSPAASPAAPPPRPTAASSIRSSPVPTRSPCSPSPRRSAMTPSPSCSTRNGVGSASSSSPERSDPDATLPGDRPLHPGSSTRTSPVSSSQRLGPTATWRPPTGSGGSRRRCSCDDAASSWSSGSSSASTSPALATSPASHRAGDPVDRHVRRWSVLTGPGSSTSGAVAGAPLGGRQAETGSSQTADELTALDVLGAGGDQLRPGTPRGCRSDRPWKPLARNPGAVGELVQFVVRRVADEVTPLLAAPPPACLVDQDRHPETLPH